MPVPTQYRRWFNYEKDAHAKTLASLRAAERTHAASEDFQKAVDFAGHIVAARLLWLYRFGMLDRRPDPLFPIRARVEDVAGAFDEMHAAWAAYLARLDDRELAREFEYEATDGGRFRNTVEDVLAQLFGHSWYHRGQIALLLRRMGAEPAVTDFVFWARETI